MPNPVNWTEFLNYILPTNPMVKGEGRHTTTAPYSAQVVAPADILPMFVVQDATIITRILDAAAKGFDSTQAIFPAVDEHLYKTASIGPEASVGIALQFLLITVIIPVVRALRAGHNQDVLLEIPKRRYSQSGDISLLSGNARLSVENKIYSVMMDKRLDLAKPRPLKAAEYSTGADAIAIKLALQMQDLDNARFGMLYSGYTCCITERVINSDGQHGLAFSEMLQVTDTLLIPPNQANNPNYNKPVLPCKPLPAILTALLCSDLQDFRIAPSAYDFPSTGLPTPPHVDSNDEFDEHPAEDRDHDHDDDHRHEGDKVSHTGPQVNNFQIVALDEQLEIVINHPISSPAARYARQIMLSASGITGSSLPSPPTSPTSKENIACLRVWLRQKPSSQHVQQLPVLPFTSGMHTKHLTLTTPLPRGAVGWVWKGSTTIVDQPLARVFKMFSREHTAFAMRETAMYVAVINDSAASAVAPTYHGTYSILHGGWCGLLLEDVGDACPDNDVGFGQSAEMEFTSRMRQQVYDAALTLHAAGIIHGDIAPRNVVFTPAGDVKLIDYNMAMLHDCPGPDCGELVYLRQELELDNSE